MGMHLSILALALPITLVSVPGFAGTAEFKDVADTISAYADRMCGEFVLKGESQKLELSGDAKAELDSLLKKLANLGISGTAKFETGSYENVLQSELGNRLNVVTECKSKISSDMSPMLTEAMKLPPVTNSIQNNGNNNVNIIGNNNSTGK